MNILLDQRFNFNSVQDFKKLLIFLCLLIVPWTLFVEILNFKEIIFYNSLNVRIFFSNLIFALFIIFFFRSIFLSFLIFYLFNILPFITYYFLRKGVMYSDLKDIGELMFALGTFSSTIIFIFFTLVIIATFIINYHYFKIKIFIIQMICVILIFGSFLFSESYKKVFYSKKKEDGSGRIVLIAADNIVVENISAAFRFIGPVDAFFYNYLDTLTFENKLKTKVSNIYYDDFRNFELGSNQLKNIHIIVMESFVDPIDFKNINIDKNLIPKKWIEYKNDYLFHGMSPVTGGGSAQAEFEILCGVPSFKKYGTEFNRIGKNQTTCLPNYLKRFNYKTIASQPVYGSFFNIKNAYKSIGFDEAFLANDFDMTEKNNGWLSNKSFFNQQFEMIEKSLSNKKPMLNYLFAVGCHNSLGQKQSYEKLIKFNESKNLEGFLNCNLKSIYEILKYIDKIKSLDPDSIIIILSDHPPALPTKIVKKSGFVKACNVRPKCSFQKMRGIFISKNISIGSKNYGYYEIPELIINELSNNKLCAQVRCNTEKDYIVFDSNIVYRESMYKVSNQPDASYYDKLYLSILKESWTN